uniref:FLYWCH-type domain-containing protein n=1 Tax=Meloidogyne enterolobii TaxID=390850 RepID=A0A6V7VSJ9_MELEN|nr:unnamed protein product [Meloidogyne enterolobii]
MLHNSQRNCEKYSHNGFSYVKDKDSADGERIFWRCDEKSNGCKGRIWTTSCENREFIRLVTEHSCSSTGNSVRVAVQQTLTTINIVQQQQWKTQLRLEAMLYREFLLQSYCFIFSLIDYNQNI